MGQALQKLRGPGAVRAAARAGESPRPQANPQPSAVNPSAVTRVDAAQPSPATLRQSVEVKPQPPEPQPIIEPNQNTWDWDRGDPKYSAMVQQVVGKITTRPGGQAEMGTAHVTAEIHRPKPMNRHTTAATGPDEEKVVAPGSLNIAGIQEVLRLHQGLSEGQAMPLSAKALAEKFSVDVELLVRVLQYTSLPESQRPEPSTQTRPRKSKVLA